jgi:hypothetical protein
MKTKIICLPIILAFINFDAQAQTSLSKKLESIPTLATIQKLITTFGNKFQIRRETWWQEGSYEIYYPEKGFGLLVSLYYVPHGPHEQRFIGVFIYPKKYPDSEYHGITIKNTQQLKAFKQKGLTYKYINLGDMGPVVRPVVFSDSLYKDEFSISVYMPLINSEQVPNRCKDYTASSSTSIGRDCEFQLDMNVDGTIKSISTRPRVGMFRLLHPIDFDLDNARIIKSQMNLPIERILIVHESSFPPPEELKELK